MAQQTLPALQELCLSIIVFDYLVQVAAEDTEQECLVGFIFKVGVNMQQPEPEQVTGPAAESAVGRRKQLYFSEQSQYATQCLAYQC